MYTRYIPQADGSYRRNRIPEPQPVAPKPQPAPEIPICPPTPEQPPCQNCMHAHAKPQNVHYQPRKQSVSSDGFGVSQFFRKFLPKDFNTEDLLVILMLLLMAGDCIEEQNTALLTMALYLFL